MSLIREPNVNGMTEYDILCHCRFEVNFQNSAFLIPDGTQAHKSGQ
jgi:hypothetical protein